MINNYSLLCNFNQKNDLFANIHFSNLYSLEKISLSVEVICNINNYTAFGDWFGHVDYTEEWNNLLKSKGAKKEIARWADGSYFWNYQYGGGVTFIYGNDIIVNSDIEGGKYMARVSGIIAK